MATPFDETAFDENRDATRRTRLANERTYLAWWRTGLTALAVCIGLGRIVPNVADVTKWPYELVGAGYGLLGVVFIGIAHFRIRAVETSLRQGEFAHIDDKLTEILLAIGVVLGLATVALIIFGG